MSPVFSAFPTDAGDDDAADAAGRDGEDDTNQSTQTEAEVILLASVVDFCKIENNELICFFLFREKRCLLYLHGIPLNDVIMFKGQRPVKSS